MLDREALHQYLWEISDTHGRLRINQAHLAEDLGYHRVTITNIFSDFQKQGKLRKIKGGYRRVVMYEVIDPEIWLKEQDGNEDS